jgi:two-component system OmpR family response regulator
MKVLVVEDEVKVRRFIKRGLGTSEMTVDTASAIDEVFANMLSVKYDVIVLDRLLGGVDAIKYIAEIKKHSPETKIIVLSALAEVDDKVNGLATGADDYLGKPFHLTELAARIRALHRRAQAEAAAAGSNTLAHGDIVVKLDSQRVERAGKRINLTPKEYKLLVFMMGRPNRVFSKSELINDVWELQYYPESNVVEVVVNHLRSKIDKGFPKPVIHSRRGVGYWFGDADI